MRRKAALTSFRLCCLRAAAGALVAANIRETMLHYIGTMVELRERVSA